MIYWHVLGALNIKQILPWGNIPLGQLMCSDGDKELVTYSFYKNANTGYIRAGAVHLLNFYFILYFIARLGLSHPQYCK